MVKIALAGNPNVGKSVIFNALTGLNQRIANFPGCTVEKKEGKMAYQGRRIEVIDLPGIYSLSPHSIDEEVSRKFIIEESPDLIVVVLDASNLERNLYLTVQLMELGVNLVAVLNMVDLARGKGIIINSQKLSENLGIPVIETIATKEVGISKLKAAIMQHIEKPIKPKPIIWGGKIEASLQVILNEIAPYSARIEKKYPLNWLAISLLENDKFAWEIVTDCGIPREALKEKIESITKNEFKGDAVIAVVDARYDIIKNLIKGVLVDYRGKQWALSDMLDEVLTNRFLGIPIFLAIMWGVFQLTFTIGQPLVDLIGLGIAKLSELVFYLADLMDGAGNGINPITNFIVGALLNGFGTIISFIPYLIILFIALAILEDTGYLSRVAFNMDRAMSKVGLEGQAIIPMLLGFGCNVPAIMATRAIKNPQSRKTAILVNSFMSCSARLPVFILLAGSIFPTFAGLVTLSLYVLGVLIGLSFAWLFRKTLFRGGDSYLIIELQPFTRPSVKGVAIKMWNQTKEFFKKASSIILISVITIYLLDASGLLEYLGRGVAYLFWWMKTADGSPIGWEYGAALLSGFVAKEVIIGTLSTLLNFDPSAPLASNPLVSLGPAAGYGLLVFILLYIPCVATLAVIKKETGSKKWMLFSLAFTISVGYLFSVIAYFLVRAITAI